MVDGVGEGHGMTCSAGGVACPRRLEVLGSGIEAVKLAKRVSCALGALGWTANVAVRHDPQRALAVGARRDPVLLLDEALFAEGLVRTEDLEDLLRAALGDAIRCPARA